MIKTIIFDLDGVLINTDIWHRQAWRETIHQYKLPDSSESHLDMVRGMGRLEGATYLTKGTDVPAQEFAESKNMRYVKFIDTLSPISSLSTVLNYLSDSYKLVVASKSTNGNYVLHKLDIERYL